MNSDLLICLYKHKMCNSILNYNMLCIFNLSLLVSGFKYLIRNLLLRLRWIISHGNGVSWNVIKTLLAEVILVGE